jgi:hypothetical protein
MKPPTPVTPAERSGPDNEGMQQQTHLTRFLGSTALPLTLFALASQGRQLRMLAA